MFASVMFDQTVLFIDVVVGSCLTHSLVIILSFCLISHGK